MRTILSQKIPKRSLSSLIAVLLLAGTVSLGTACDDDKDFSRREHIEWSTTPDFDIPVGTLHVPVRFSETNPTASYMTKIYIKANVEYQATFETDEEETEPDWIRIAGINRNVRPGIDELELEIDAHPGAYEERKGCISLITGAEYLNDFISVVQGFPARVEGDFDWLKYGSADPLETKGETLIANWTTEQKDKGWESTPAQEEGTAYCYGKNGYIKLGDGDGHGASLMTPYKPDIRVDTAVMVRFNAVAYAAADGTKDANKLTIKVVGGGEFFDGTTSKVITLNYIDPAAEELGTAMWENSQQEFILVSHPKNKFTSETRVEVMAGDYVMESGNTRIFIDNFYIFRLRWYDYEYFFDAFPWTER